MLHYNDCWRDHPACAQQLLGLIIDGAYASPDDEALGVIDDAVAHQMNVSMEPLL